MEDRFRVLLGKALDREGISAADLAKEVGLDKAYFVDLLAGRKKTVSASAFMIAAKRLAFDPWEVVGIEAPLSVMSPRREELNAPAPVRSPRAKQLETVGITMVIEEGAFRDISVMPEGRSLPLVEGFDRERQSVAVVKGGDYERWGVASGALLQLVTFERYDAVSPGRMVVCRSSKGELEACSLRRVTVSDGGDLVFEAPLETGGTDISAGWSVAGLVVAMSFPLPTFS